MQIMPETGEWIAGEMGIENFTPDQLTNVQTNIKMGTWYLAYLLHEYDGNKVLALAAYNAGRGHVDSWMEEYGWEKNFQKLKKYPLQKRENMLR